MTDTRIDQMRKNYTLGGLLENEADRDPMVQFARWFEQAIGNGPTDDHPANATADDRTALLSSESTVAGIPPWLEPNAMTLSTATPDGQVSSRTVLLKGIENGCFVFYSNYESIKGRQIAQNPHVSLCLYWPHLQRQVLVRGTATRIDRQRSQRYFHSRPRTSQLGAIASVQSSPIESREVLERKYADLDKQFPEGTEIPLPDDWGGYEVTPNRIEFWQGRTSRLHDRLVYSRDQAAHNQAAHKQATWVMQRLSP